MPDLRLGAFILATLVLAHISRRSIVRPRSHGFFRFWAWEAITGLVLLHAPLWFLDWSSGHQLFSWILLVGSLFPLILGMRALRQPAAGEQNPRTDPELLAFERTGRVISEGVFKYIRHPLYCSLLLLAWGVFFKAPSWLAGLLALAATISLLLTARADERECIVAFGDDYRSYMHRTKMFIPYVL
jgi:protein-S-isoprenylcysteine O-methyltransferase Ste14